MGFAGFLGNALIAGGPGLALFCVFIAQRSFLLLLFLARYSSLRLHLLQALWLTSAHLVLAIQPLRMAHFTDTHCSTLQRCEALPLSSCFRQASRPHCGMPCCLRAGLVPLSEHPGALPAALVVGVAAQEATRYCAWLAHRHVPRGIKFA